jgi:hypothetical protein
MKKGFLLLSMIAITYLLTTTIYSYFFGLPPFNYGITVGYPTIYYSFRVSPIETQYGFIGGINIFYNILIILGIYILIQWMINYKRVVDEK